MLRSVKNIFWMLALVAGAQSALGFALIGPPDTTGTSDDFQTATLNYGWQLGDKGTPKALKEEYRRNTPILYYAVDQSFFDYFGTNGTQAIDDAFALYNSVGKVTQLDVNDYPEDSRRVNFSAQTIGLMDLKSYVAGLLTYELGLFEPSRWVWALSLRVQLPHPPGTPPCPFNMGYNVYQRNYDSTLTDTTNLYPTSSYVNGVLYSYYINEFCTGPINLADAVEFPVDPLTQPYSAVADSLSFWYEGLLPGAFYTSLTRDDVMGLKYLYDTNNFNLESAGIRVTEFVTNDMTQAQVVTTQDLGALASAARNLTAAQLQGLFPGLIVTSTSNFFGFQITTNITQLLVNKPFDPAGTPPTHPVTFTNYTTNVLQFFVHSFGNIVTNTFGTRGLVGTVNLGITNSPFAIAGTPPTTNVDVRISPQSGVFGDFFILPTNFCGAVILSNMLTTWTGVTNLPGASSNAPPTGNTNAITFVPGNVTFTTNHTLIYLPVTCPTNAIARRGGVDQIQFVSRPYDSIIGRTWDPITNNYTVIEFNDTNGVYTLRHFSRRVPLPDFLFSAANFSGVTSTLNYTNTVDGAQSVLTVNFAILAPGIGIALELDNFVLNGSRQQHNWAYDENAKAGNQAGPGTIINSSDAISPRIFIFNSQFPVYQNLSAGFGSTNSFLNPTQEGQANYFAWGSFDGTTNPPVVYPNQGIFLELQDLLLGPQSATPFLPDGNIGLLYSAQLAAKAGTAPYTFALAPNSAGLPAGLNLTSDGKIAGTPTGPAAIYDFTVRITDSAGKNRDVQFTITIF